MCCSVSPEVRGSTDNLDPKGFNRNSAIHISNATKWHFLLGTATCGSVVTPDTKILPVAMVIYVAMVTSFQGFLLARRVP